MAVPTLRLVRGTRIAALAAMAAGVLGAPAGAWAAPAFTGALPADPANVTSATFAFTADDPATASCRLDGVELAAPCTSPREVTGLADGPHRFEVQADGAAVAHAWTVDTVAPETTMTAGPKGPIGETSATFAFEASEPGSTFVCRLDAGPWEPCASPHERTGMSEGSHRLSARAIDRAGNLDVTEAWRAFEVRPAGAAEQGGADQGSVDAGSGGAAITGTPTSTSTSGAGTGFEGGAAAVFDPVPPGLTRLTAPRLRLGRRVVLRWRLSEPARVTLRVERRSVRRGRVRWSAVPGSILADGVVGENGRAFWGRIGARVLRRGTYRLVARAQDAAGHRSPLVRAGFRVTR